MIRRSTLILLGIFILALGATYYLEFVREPVESETTPTTTGMNEELFPDVESADAASITIRSASGDSVEIERNSEGTWVFSDPTNGELDSTEAESMVNSLFRLTSIVPLNPADDLGVYGLLQPAYEVNITLTGGQTHRLEIGDQAPTGNGYYVRVDDNQPKVGPNYVIEDITGFLENPPLAPTPTPDVTATSTAEPDVDETSTP